MAIRQGALTSENLLDTAPETAALYNLAQQRPVNPQDIARMALQPLPMHFPESILFFLHRGIATAAYSGFYYPLVTVAFRQFGLAAEEAIREYAARQGIATKRKSGSPKGFQELLRELGTSGKLTRDQQRSWQNIRALRNLLAHPDSKMIASFAMVFDPLDNLINELKLLFPEPVEEKMRFPPRSVQSGCKDSVPQPA